MESFSDELCADDDVDLVVMHVFEKFFELIFFGECIGSGDGDSCVWGERGDFACDSFDAPSFWEEGRGFAAVGALRG